MSLAPIYTPGWRQTLWTFLQSKETTQLHCQGTQRQNECACSAFSWASGRASGHFLVSGYDQKAIITEKVPVLCSLEPESKRQRGKVGFVERV